MGNYIVRISRDAYNKMCECNHRELAFLPIGFLVDALLLSGWHLEDVLRTHEDEEGVYNTVKMSQDEMIERLLFLKTTGAFSPIVHKDWVKRSVDERVKSVVNSIDWEE